MTTAQISRDSHTITARVEVTVQKGRIFKPLDRHDYLGSGGRSTSSTLDFNSGVVGSATPRPAKMIAPSIGNDLERNPNRRLICLYMKQWSDGVDFSAEVFKTVEREHSKLESPGSSISICLDGTCQSLCDDGWQEAMCATVSLYAAPGLPLLTNYTPSYSESGMAGSRVRLEQNLEKVKALYLAAVYIGFANGSRENRSLLKNLPLFKLYILITLGVMVLSQRGSRWKQF